MHLRSSVPVLESSSSISKKYLLVPPHTGAPAYAGAQSREGVTHVPHAMKKYRHVVGNTLAALHSSLFVPVA